MPTKGPMGQERQARSKAENKKGHTEKGGWRRRTEGEKGSQRERKRSKFLDYIGKRPWGQHCPGPKLESSEMRAEYARKGLRDARRTRRKSLF